MLAVAIGHIFANVLEISRAAQAGRTVERQAQMTVGRLRDDVAGARQVLAVSGTTLDLLAADGSLVSYTLAGSDSLRRRVNGGAWRLVAADVDSLELGIQTVARPYTRETMLPDTVESRMRGFEPGDWDALVSSTDCDYLPRGERRIQDDDYVMIQFWQQTAGFFAFSRVQVRMRAIDHNPCESDLWVRVQKEDAWGWPGTVVAQGILSRLSVPAGGYNWVSIDLTPVVFEPVVDGINYWLVFRSSGSGSNSYAGHFEYERIEDCDHGEWPVTNANFWYTTNGYSGYSGGGSDWEGFHRLYGLTTTPRLAEVTETLTDTLGVTYALVLRQGEEIERRAGFIALYSP